ncbi:MAG: hypothetical protein KME02_07045 [Aphanothece saxicola GSE-SYN-MK-01-06B]|nr:hypothetical protein [Aphanothece saxicola GSE-SYN-MK-01-06B]
MLGTVAQLRSAMKEQGVGLKRANALLQRKGVVALPGPATQQRIDWQLMVEGFRSFKLSSGAVKASTFERMYEPVMQAVMAELAASPAPADAPELSSGWCRPAEVNPAARGGSSASSTPPSCCALP